MAASVGSAVHPPPGEERAVFTQLRAVRMTAGDGEDSLTQPPSDSVIRRLAFYGIGPSATGRALRAERYGPSATGRALRAERYGPSATGRALRAERYGPSATGPVDCSCLCLPVPPGVVLYCPNCVHSKQAFDATPPGMMAMAV
ncbi:hypothetical protein NHX12_010396 [Muraenolepis orangiensis]|uniref:Uncharacterized protein n=1 Tax=Muraenolepis orangiensis TaxID=630683 RepID=A0A9Q0DJN2_9TELE|nr:hypothetical protein NHX12_010396 [Muraenolepis orangiensis]